jgi:hypothetical protein
VADTNGQPGYGLEPWPGGVIVGADYGRYRVRYLQHQFSDGNWYTVALSG